MNMNNLDRISFCLEKDGRFFFLQNECVFCELLRVNRGKIWTRSASIKFAHMKASFIDVIEQLEKTFMDK